MFCGRGAELISIRQSLFQTKNGNPKHFLIEGERGIGKSSLMLYVNMLATNQMPKMGEFNFITMQIELSDAEDLEPIREVLIHEQSFVLARRRSMILIMARRVNAATVRA
jgi:ABC-type arginine transport system ATPase subunit